MTRWPALLLALIVGCQGGNRVDPTVAIVGATVIPMSGKADLVDATVLVGGGRILTVGPRASTNVPDGVRVIDGAGRFLIPGLWDMHVHALVPGEAEHLLGLFLAHGVTGVRDMNGPMPLAEIRELGRRIDAGELAGPRIMAAGRLVDGPARSPSARGPHTAVVADTAEVRAAVGALAAEGADFIKLYHALPPPLFRAAIGAARDAGLAAVGHLPLFWPADSAARAGLRSVEHLQGVFESASAQGDSLRRLYATLLDSLTADRAPSPGTAGDVFRLRAGVIRAAEPARLQHLAGVFASSGTWHVPTLVSNRGMLLGQLDPTLASDPRRAALPDDQTAGWAHARPPYRPDSALQREHFARLIDLVGLLSRSGVRLLAGTDFGVAFVYPGSSVADELELMERAGLTPAEALATATVNPAEFFGMSDSLGTIEPGKLADIVMLGADPRSEVGRTRE